MKKLQTLEYSELKQLLNEAKAQGFMEGFMSLYNFLPEQDTIKKDDIRLKLSKLLTEKYHIRNQSYILLNSPEAGLEAYWKNIGSYLNMAIEDETAEIDSAVQKDQPSFL